MANFTLPFRIHLCFLLRKQPNNLEFHKQTKIQTDRHLALFRTRQVRTGQDGSGQVRICQERLGQVSKGQLRSAQVSTGCMKHPHIR